MAGNEKKRTSCGKLLKDVQAYFFGFSGDNYAI